VGDHPKQGLYGPRFQHLTDSLLLDAAATYLQVSGSSASTAIVAGAAGLVLSATANAAATDMVSVREAMLEGADRVAALNASTPAGDGQLLVGDGRRLNAYNALAAYIADPTVWPWLPEELCGTQPALPPSPPSPPSPPPPHVSCVLCCVRCLASTLTRQPRANSHDPCWRLPQWNPHISCLLNQAS
jgi:subtilisin family serine protease